MHFVTPTCVYMKLFVSVSGGGVLAFMMSFQDGYVSPSLSFTGHCRLSKYMFIVDECQFQT